MGIESQGMFVRRASTSIATAVSSVAMDIASTTLNCSAGVDFGALGFTTDHVIAFSSGNTGLYPIKKVNTTCLDIYGTFPTTGAFSSGATVNGYNMGDIGEVTDFTGPGGAAAVIDVSHLGSTAKEKLMGLRDEGQLSLTLNFNATDTGQLGLVSDRAARIRNLYDVIFHDTTWTSSAFPSRAWFWAYSLQYSVAGAVDDKVVANSVLEITGPVVWATHCSS